MQELIYNQAQIPKDQWRYGLRSSASTGCGWIAVNNALVLMGQDVDIPHLIRSCQRQAPLIHGNAGTLFFGPGLLLKQWGFPTAMCNHPRQYDELLKEWGVGILFYYWREGLKIGSHFVAVQYSDQGFWGYNTYRNSTGPDYYGPSLQTYLKKQGFFATVLTLVRTPPEFSPSKP